MKVGLFLLVKKIEHLIKIFSFAIPKFKTHSKYGFGFSYQQKNPFKISLYSKLKTELKHLFKTLFLMTATHRLVSIYTVLTLVGLSVSIYSLLSNEATSDFKNKAPSSSLVLAEQSSVEDYLITFNNETLFNQPVTFAQPIVAPNVTYSVTAGTGMTIGGADPQNPVIINSGVISLAGLRGQISLEAGENMEINLTEDSVVLTAKDVLEGKIIGVSQGGTGASGAADARQNLGLVIDRDILSYSAVLKNIGALSPSASGFLTTDENQNWVMVSGAFARNRIGLGKDNEVEFKKITIGENEGLNIDSAGNFTKINGVVIRFPSVQGALNSVLLNDGAGNLIWTDSTGSGSIGYFSRNNLTTTLSTSNAGDSLNLGTGSLIMSGAVTTSGIISGTGSGLTNLNASNISSGTIPVASVVGTYANITGVGTLSSGTWQGAPVADTYIQSAVNWNTAYSNRITSLTTSGSSGASTLTSNTLNIPTYTLAGLGGQPQLNGTGFVKINGTTIIYDANTYLTGNETITLSGDVSGSGATAITTTIGDGKVTNAKLSNSSITIGSTSVSLGSSITALSDITSLSVNGIISGTGSGLTNLNASNISSGTIPAASVVGAYPNITGVGTLSSLNVTGAITSGDITSSNIISGTSFRGGLGSISEPTFSFTSDSNTGIFSRTDILGLVTSGTEQMTILSNGRVGIGTTNPTVALQVVGDITSSGIISGTGSGLTNLNASNISSGTIPAASVLNISGNAATATSLTTARTIWGQLFNGTASITGDLTGVTSITASNIISGTSFRGGLGSISAPTFSFTNDSNTGIFSPSADILGFVTSGTERMRIDANGIGVNTSGQTRTISTYNGANSDGENIFIGGGGTSSVGALEETYKGSNNTSVGVSALLHNTTGYFNSAMGMAALVYNTTGYNNTGLGFGAGYSLSDNIPNKRITSDYDMTLIGYGATKNSASQLNNSIAIGVGTLVTASNTAMWGNASMTSHIFQAGNVGIGTTSPTVALQVVGAITASGIISGTGSGLTNLNASNISSGTIPAASVVGAYPNITGVGTLSSLNVTGAITSGDITSSNIISGTSFRGGLGSISAPTFSFTSDPNTGIFSRTDILGLVTSGTEQMTILSNGRVGIGTTNPSSKLEVVGQLLASGASGFIQSSNQIIAPRGLMGMGSGTLTSSGTAPTGTYPNSVTVDPSGRFVYVANSVSNTVSSYTINQTTGTLTSSGTAPTGTSPWSVNVDPSGRFVYVANSDSFTVSSYTINQTTGTLTSSGTAPTGANPTSVTVDPSGRFVYVTNSGGNDTVSSFTINQTTGTLTSSGTALTGTSPNSATVDPSGRFVYVANNLSNNVSSYTINQTTGTLTSSGTALTGTYPTSVTVDPSGRFVYVANINSQNVSSYTINQTTGTLTSSGTAPTGSGPYSVNVDPSGRFAYVANNNSQNVSSYTINQTTGTLTSSGTAPTGINPNSVTVDPSGRFVYVAHSGSNIVSSYTINNFSAGSAFFAGNVGIGTTNPGYRLDLPNVANATGQGRANAWVTYSDLSLKENISPLIDSLDKVISLRGVSFEWKGSGIASSGFIAQEVEKIIPDLVSTDIAGIKAIDYSRLTPYLVSAIQEQQLQISGISSNLSTLTEELDLKLNEETGEIVTSISSLINSTSATNDLINLNQTANITTITALDSRVEVLENYSLDISDFQASASATLSELNQRIGLFEQIMSLTSTDSATLSASSALESLIDSRILGAFTSQIATFSALTVTSGANINNLAVTGNITNGLLTINGFDDSLATPSATLSTLSGPLKIQHQALGEIDFMGGKAIIDTEGNLKIVSGDLVVESGLIKGNNLNRGSNIEVLQNTDTIEILFSKPRENDDYAVVITSSWITTSAVTQKNVNGFYVKFGILAPMDAKFDWVIID